MLNGTNYNYNSNAWYQFARCLLREALRPLTPLDSKKWNNWGLVLRQRDSKTTRIIQITPVKFSPNWFGSMNHWISAVLICCLLVGCKNSAEQAEDSDAGDVQGSNGQVIDGVGVDVPADGAQAGEAADDQQVAGNNTADGSTILGSKAPLVADVENPGAEDQVESAIANGFDLNQADPQGRTLLMMAAFEGYTGAVEKLLDNGADVDQLDQQGRSALMYAASGPFPNTVRLLVDRKAELNRVDQNEGWTALMLAAAEGNRKVVEILLTNGADAGIADNDGDHALDHAREREQDEIVALLESWKRKN